MHCAKGVALKPLFNCNSARLRRVSTSRLYSDLKFRRAMSDSSDSYGGRSPKRFKLSDDGIDSTKRQRRSLSSFQRAVSPPARLVKKIDEDDVLPGSAIKKPQQQSNAMPHTVPSPFHLTHIRDMSQGSGNNIDTVKVRDILGDPMIKECWQFNYCFDIDWLMEQLDPDVRDLVAVKIVHGSWKKDSPNRQRIDDACQRYKNVEPIVAYMPEPFGTHHSKMMVLIRHDDHAQVIIHTANMISGDWANMSQAVWRSPLLPKFRPSPDNDTSQTADGKPIDAAVGSGLRFKRDLLNYLRYYGVKKTGNLVSQLEGYDFSAVRGALIASVPSRQSSSRLDSSRTTLWGWPALKDTLSRVPLSPSEDNGDDRPHIVIQISSVATLGQTDKWLTKTLYESLNPRDTRSFLSSSKTKRKEPKYSIIFPTPDEIRRSLNGYGSGGSIHMKLQSMAQKKQLQYLRKYLCHWAGDAKDTGRRLETEQGEKETGSVSVREAGRRRAAPHIKTYIRFADKDMTRIDWGMITSANLSTQAWGSAANDRGEIRICSWEIGVLVWPELFTDGGQGQPQEPGQEGNKPAVMVPVFKRDTVPEDALPSVKAGVQRPTSIVGFRMPYDLPLTPYGETDIPWSNSNVHTEPDWMGQTWGEDL